MPAGKLLCVPQELLWVAGRPLLKMVEIPQTALGLPFWQQSLAAAVRVSGLVQLDSEDDLPSGAGLSGFIYHYNRCGSTMVCNMLKASHGCMAISEPFVFQQLLDSPHGSASERCRWLRRLMALHLTAMAGVAERVVIKWSGLMCLYCDTIEDAFPATPAVFLYRNPVEVLVSERHEPIGNFALVKEQHLALPDADGREPYSDPEKMAFLMAHMCRCISRSSTIRTLDYRRLPGAVAGELADCFALALSTDDRIAMQAGALRYSKSPKEARIFEDDSIQKREAASAEERCLCRDIIEPALASLTARLPPLCARAS